MIDLLESSQQLTHHPLHQGTQNNIFPYFSENVIFTLIPEQTHLLGDKKDINIVRNMICLRVHVYWQAHVWFSVLYICLFLPVIYY